MKEKIKKQFIKWCDEPMSSNGNDRKEMFEKIWQEASSQSKKELLEKIEERAKGIREEYSGGMKRFEEKEGVDLEKLVYAYNFAIKEFLEDIKKLLT